MAGKAWSGVFTAATDRRVEQFTESVSFDRRLYAHDIQASIAHAQMLATVGLLTRDECQQIEQGLRRRFAKKLSKADSSSRSNWKTSTCTSSGR